MEMKSSGMYVSRGLSFKDAEVSGYFIAAASRLFVLTKITKVALKLRLKI